MLPLARSPLGCPFRVPVRRSRLLGFGVAVALPCHWIIIENPPFKLGLQVGPAHTLWGTTEIERPAKLVQNAARSTEPLPGLAEDIGDAPLGSGAFFCVLS